MSGLEGLGIVTNVIAVVDLSLKVISWCSKYAQDVKNAKDSRAQLLLAIHKLHYQSEKLKCLLDDDRKRAKLQASSKLAHAMGNGEFKLKNLESLLSSRSRGSGMRWPLQKQEVESGIHSIEHSTEIIMHVLEVDMAGILVDLDDRAEAEQQRNLLDRLPFVTDAAFDSHAEEHNPTCLSETRVDLLKEVNDWVNDPQAKTVFWLNGMAGTGKSTISRTLAQSLSKSQQTEKQLGASFFFKRGEKERGNMSKLVPTIARQLATSYPALATHMQQALQRDSSIPNKGLRIQFEKLIIEPLSQSSLNLSLEATVVIIVDGLDECESDNDIKLIIHLFSQSRVIQHPRVRVFLTSRPELPIRLGFKAVQGTFKDFVLHQVSATIIEHDISLFLRHELAKIRADWNTSVSKSRSLPLNWPGDDYIRLLTEKAIPLFIFAATVCRFIADYRGRRPPRQLQKVLQFQIGTPSSQMDITYRPVLSQLLSEECSPSEAESIKHDFKRIVGSIVLLFSPLSSSALSRLLDIAQDIIDDMLDSLHSVLNVPPSPEAPIRMLHLSFRDYLVSPQADLIYVNEKKTSRTLVKHCFRVMGGLKADICHLRHPAKPRSVLKSEFIDAFLPPEVQYACLYWVYHQESAGIGEGDVSTILSFLKEHLLHWIEALTLLGKVWQVNELIRRLRNSLATTRVNEDTNLIELLDDAIMLFHRHASDVNDAPLQLYSSVLVFAPTNSILRKIFAAQAPPWITLLSGRAHDLDPRLQLFNPGGSEIVTTFSSDSKLLSFISEQGKIRVWSTDTGECVEEFNISQRIYLAAISSDGKAIVFETWEAGDGCIQIIDLAAGGCVSDFTELTRSSWALEFSPDSALILSASLDGQVIVWDRLTGNCVQRLFIEPPVDVWPDYNISSNVKVWADLEFSPSCTAILVVDKDHKIYVWCLEREKEILIAQAAIHYRGQAFNRESTAFSRDSKLLAIISGEHEVQIWSLDKAECIWSHREDTFVLMGVSFSPDCSRIAAISDDQDLRIWDTSTSECFSTLSGWGKSIGNAQFSPISDYVVSSSLDSINSSRADSDLRIWGLKTGGSVSTPQTNLPRVKSLLFSPDGAVLASVSFEGLIQLWDWYKLSNEPRRDKDGVIALRLIPNPPRVVRISANGNVKVLRSDAGTKLQDYSIPTPVPMYPASLQFSHDSMLVVPKQTQEYFKIWSLFDGYTMLHIERKNVSFVFSHNYERIATTAADQCEICVWDRRDRKFNLQYLLRGPEGRCWPHAFSSDARWLVAKDDSERMWVWDLDSRKCIGPLLPTDDQNRRIGRIAISPHSAVVAAVFNFYGVNSYCVVAIWHLATGDRVGVVSLNDCTYSLTLSSVGTFMPCSSYGKIDIWNWETGLCLAEAKTPGTFWEVLDFLPGNSGLRTTDRNLTFPGDILETPEPGSKPRELPITPKFTPKFTVEEQWVQYRGHDLVKLPAELRERTVAVLDNIVAFDGEWGNIILVRFSEEGLKIWLGE